MINADIPYLNFLDCLKQFREALCADILAGNPYLDTAFLQTSDEVRKIYYDIYELIILKTFWQNTKHLQHVDWFRDFFASFNCSDYDRELFQEKLILLEQLLVKNEKWDENSQKFEVLFNKSKKLLEHKRDLLLAQQ